MILTLPEAWCSTLFTSDCSFTWPSGRAIEVTRCAITRCREIMTPQLSIVKTRFAKASLRARCARHRSWRPPCRLPNRRAGTLSFPMVALDTQLPNSRDGSSGRSTTGGEFAQTWFTWSCARASSNGFVQLGTDGCQRSSVRERYR